MIAKRRIILISVFILLELFFVLSVKAQSTGDEKESLRGLQGVGLRVQNINLDDQPNGLENLQSQLKTKLQKAGIKVLSDKEWMEAPGSPFLYVQVSAKRRRDTNLYDAYSEVGLQQKAALVRKPSIVKFIETWKRGSSQLRATISLETVRGEIDKNVDQFINDYLTVNQK